MFLLLWYGSLNTLDFPYKRATKFAFSWKHDRLRSFVHVLSVVFLVMSPVVRPLYNILCDHQRTRYTSPKCPPSCSIRWRHYTNGRIDRHRQDLQDVGHLARPKLVFQNATIIFGHIRRNFVDHRRVFICLFQEYLLCLASIYTRWTRIQYTWDSFVLTRPSANGADQVPASGSRWLSNRIDELVRPRSCSWPFFGREAPEPLSVHDRMSEYPAGLVGSVLTGVVLLAHCHISRPELLLLHGDYLRVSCDEEPYSPKYPCLSIEFHQKLFDESANVFTLFHIIELPRDRVRTGTFIFNLCPYWRWL